MCCNFVVLTHNLVFRCGQLARCNLCIRRCGPVGVAISHSIEDPFTGDTTVEMRLL